MDPRRTGLRLVAGATAPGQAQPAGPDAGIAALARGGLAGLRALVREGRPVGDDGWPLFWQGYLEQFDDLARARATWLRAEEQFAATGDEEGLALAACALTQCVLLDNQSFDGFESRCARALAVRVDSGAATPRALMVDAAHLLLSQQDSAVPDAGGSLRRVFSAMNSPLDPEVRLRAAVAALHALGLDLDAVQADDFLAAGAQLAGDARVGAYGRALWHLFVAESRFVDAKAGVRLAGELDRALAAARECGSAALQARAHLIQAAISLGAGDLTAGSASLTRAHHLLEPRYARDYALYHFLCSRQLLQQGDADAALAHAELALVKADEAEAPHSAVTPVIMQTGFVHAALGQYREGAAAFAHAAELSTGAQVVPCECHVHLVHALAHWQGGARAETKAELAVGMAQARQAGLTHFFRALPSVASRVCDAAIALEVEVEFARKVVASRNLASPDPANARWPWPVQVRGLGGFVIERAGQPLRFGRKAPKRLLDMLRLVMALGGRQVDAARLAATLWPEAEGGDDRDALKALLHRTRTLFGTDVVSVRDGFVSFDEASVWLDTRAFEFVADRVDTLSGTGRSAQESVIGELELRRTQLLALYRGHFLGESDVPAWALPLRDRLKARFIRSIDALGLWLERIGRRDDAIGLYRAALEQDNLAEPLYRRLIECHLARGEHAEALNAYRRCRDLLSIVLGLRPAEQTERLAARITSR
jgi:LuxR family maltose regulon positive regulatory protein